MCIFFDLFWLFGEICKYVVYLIVYYSKANLLDYELKYWVPLYIFWQRIFMSDKNKESWGKVQIVFNSMLQYIIQRLSIRLDFELNHEISNNST